MRRRLQGWIASAFLVLCLLLGGASAPGAGAVGNALLQLTALAVIVTLVVRGDFARLPREARPLLWLVTAFVIWTVLTLVPLPYDLWSALPGRAPIADAMARIGVAEPAAALSLAPQSTLSSLPWLLPPVAMFLLALRADNRRRRRILWALLVFAVLSGAFGIIQQVSGPASGLRPYRITNPDSPVGFFANANHLGTLLLCALPAAGYFAARALGRPRGERRSGLAVAGALILFLLIGIAVIGSAAAYGLSVVALVAVLLIYRRARGPLTPLWLAGAGALFLGTAALALMGPLQSQQLSEEVGSASNSRASIARQTLEIIGDTLPVGSGLGSFPLLYRHYEDPARVGAEFTNHAHNDYLEIVMDLGIVGLGLILGFLAWWALHSWQGWRSSSSGAGLARAGSVMILIVLLHSLVDYPIRTSAIAAVFALACALLVPAPAPRRASARDDAREGTGLKHLEVV